MHKEIRLIIQRRGVLLSMDLSKTEREGGETQRERMVESESVGGIKNGVLGLIMYTGQP